MLFVYRRLGHHFDFQCIGAFFALLGGAKFPLSEGALFSLEGEQFSLEGARNHALFLSINGCAI